MNKLIPEFYTKFSCIGPSCEDSCCSGWKVSIDKKTYKTYKKSKNPIVKKIADKDIILLRNNTQDWSQIKLDQNGDCPALNEDKLCNIHIELGEKHLSDVCRSYPRMTKVSDSAVKVSLTLSCPEAARQILLNPSAMNFDVAQADKVQAAKRPLWFNRVHYDMIELAADGRLSLDEKLFAIGLIVDKLPADAVESIDSINQLLEYANSIKTLAFAGKCKEQLDNVEVTPQFHGKFVTLYLNCMRQLLANQSKGRGKQKLVDMIDLAVPNADVENDVTLADFHTKLKHAWNEICEPYFAHNSHILVNLLIYWLYERDFPSGLDDYSAKQSYLQLTADFTFIRGLLAGIALAKDALSEQDIVDAVYTYASATTHSPKLLKLLQEVFEQLDMSVDVAPMLLSKF